MTEKGFYFLKHTVTVPDYKSLFSQVVVGNDKSLQQDYENDIIALCQLHHIPCIKKSEFIKIETEYCLTIAWRWLIHHPEDKLIVFHDSILPKYRGFAPLMNALINKETEIGVTALYGAKAYDKGDIIAQSKSRITYPIKIHQAIQVINDHYVAVGKTILNELYHQRPLVAYPQKEQDASYSIWRDETDYWIDWRQSAEDIRRLIDALGYPYKGACTQADNLTIRITDATEVDDVVIENRHCGKVIFIEDGKPIVICGTGLLKINQAFVDVNGEKKSFLPMKKFRMRFTQQH